MVKVERGEKSQKREVIDVLTDGYKLGISGVAWGDIPPGPWLPPPRSLLKSKAIILSLFHQQDSVGMLPIVNAVVDAKQCQCCDYFGW